ncbi:MAG: hypothetical protein QGG69_01825, partial [Kiritimatiellia bacterium]|nr:hypothetical protein [Kiritimatiellia bacterium]
MVVLKKTLALPLILAALALAVQVAFVFETNRAVVFQVPTSDAASYHNQAVRIAAGEEEPGKAPFWQPPLYIYALGQVYRWMSSDIQVVRYVHGMLGVLVALLTFLVAKRFMRESVAFACGLGTCFYGPLLFFTSQLLPAALAAVWSGSFLLLFLALMRRPTGIKAFALGVILGLAALTVPVMLVMLLLVGGWLVVETRKNGSLWPQVRWGLLLAAGLVLSVAPVTIRNAVRSGQWVPISTNGGINLYIGNNPSTAETVCIRPGTREWETLVALPYEEGGVTSPARAQSFFLRRVGAYIFREPASFLGGLVAKARQLTSGREIPRNVDLYVFREHSRILGLLAWRWGPFAFPFGIVGPLALLGMVVAVRRRGEGRYLVGFVMLYGLSLVCFFPSSRYTVPVLPALLILAFLGMGALLAQLCAPPARGAAGRHALPSASEPGTCSGGARERRLYAAVLLLGVVAVNLPVAMPTD